MTKKTQLQVVGSGVDTPAPTVTTQSIRIEFRDATIKEYTDIIGYQLGSGFIGVQLKDGGLYIYPSDLIQEVFYTQG